MADWDDVLAAVAAALSGDKPEGRRLLVLCWESVSPEDHAQRCVLAHYLADVQDELDAEVGWDETALHEHGFLDNGDLKPVGIPSVQGMLPSLHLNLGDGYLRRGQGGLAREHQRAGMVRSSHLSDDGYGAMIRSGLDNLGLRISSAGA
ncbi:hypothetical protein QNO08_08425 [Arthrobacter sp. zg-Y820]|uniref:hypothetical protein n=1 Tax=unclassified Arthrobacter TaxID=235627 RepID=UPI001E3CFFA0|nr:MULTISPECIES: hypothetical protein [unclassified Arthrobacter]MCC9196857.1 hypothetical protein [Arthrobacter sp. zg-Y820]MDK1279719.1 hypothetical protein [Arthrobacter sp. zg.Y820]WIB07911.1 hypothetical protein QNO08_08425 [Arthrobacter sp. zg-Y820]